MKTFSILIGLILIVMFNSCKKEIEEREYCVNNITSPPDSSLISLVDWNKTKLLFESNGLEYINLEFYKYDEDNYGYHHMKCLQYLNGLKLFTNGISYHFDENDEFDFVFGDVVTEIDLNTKPSMSQESIIEIFIRALENDDNFYGNKNEIYENCLEIEFGYYDLNDGISYASMNFTKAWKIKPKYMDCPNAYINDQTSTLILYDNGVILD